FTATHGSLRGTRLTHWLRGTLRGLPPLMVSLPVFWIGIVLIQVFSFQLGLVPVLNASPIQSLILPVSTLAIPIAAPLAQALWRSCSRIALLHSLTLAGLLFGELVGGAVVTESVFARVGSWHLVVEAVAARCSPVRMAVVVLAAVVVVLIYLFVGLIYPVLDA